MIASVPRVAYQGEPGAFSDEAITALLAGTDVTRMAQREFADVRRLILAGDADFGVLPIENSIHGPVTAAREVMTAGGLDVVAEATCPIRLCLLAVPSAREEQLRRVLSHPVALNQCRRFLASMPLLVAVPFYDTAGAAKEVAASGDMTSAAVASLAAAAHYGLDVMARNIEDRSDNRTRFVLVARTPGCGTEATAQPGMPRQNATAPASRAASSGSSSGLNRSANPQVGHTSRTSPATAYGSSR
jgi:prephenate dehydratase